MRKSRWAVVLGFAFALGLGTSLALNGTSGFRFQGKGLTSEALPAIGAQPGATLTAVEPGSGGPIDREDVLLLYNSGSPTSFTTNFCKIAEFYGLLCKRADLNTTPVSESLLRDPEGAYFRLIGLDASALSEQDSTLNEEEIQLLERAIKSGGASLLISKATSDIGIDADLLGQLSEGAILGFFKLPDAHYDWIVSSVAPEVTDVFSGQTITSVITTTVSASALLANTTIATPLIWARDASGADLPVFVRLKKGAGEVYVDAGQLAPSLDKIQLRGLYYSSAGFPQMIPLMMTVKAAMGEEAWHSDRHYANLTIDDAALKEPFEHLSYIGLLKEMQVHNFHTTIAVIPANLEQTQPAVAGLFQNYPERFSLVQHGNNHDGYEFYKYSVSEDDELEGVKYPARPFSEQEWDIQEGLSRMEILKKQYGLSFDRVMIFPYGISPEQTLILLKKNNFLASLNTRDVPLNSTHPSDWDYEMRPAVMDFENFPLLIRRHPGSYLPFKPDIQLFLFDLFLDKPALFYSHPYSDQLFADGITAFNPVAEQVNRLPGGVEWQGLGSILETLHLEKTNDDGSVDVMMVTNHMLLNNDAPYDRIYHIIKQETLNVPIVTLTVNAKEFPFRHENDLLFVDVWVPADSSAEVLIRY